MAILINCLKCDKEFMTSACHGSSFCDDCNGVNEAKAKEAERFARLSDHEKIYELLRRVEVLERHECNPLIG